MVLPLHTPTIPRRHSLLSYLTHFCSVETMDRMRTNVESLPDTGPTVHPGARGTPGCAAVNTTADGERFTAVHLALHPRKSKTQMLPPPSQLEATTTAALAHNISSGAGENEVIDDILPASTCAEWAGAWSAMAEAGAYTLAESQVIATNGAGGWLYTAQKEGRASEGFAKQEADAC